MTRLPNYLLSSLLCGDQSQLVSSLTRFTVIVVNGVIDV